VNTNTDKTSHDSPLPATEGSALYYALLYVEQPVSTRAIETLHFIQTLSTTLHDVSEGQVAEKKIHWWHEELARLSKQQSRHPAGIAVQTYLHHQTSIAAGLQILSAAASERYTPCATESELTDMILADYRARLALLDTALDASHATSANVNEQHGNKPISFHSKTMVQDNSRSATSSQKNDAIALGLGRFDRLNSLINRLRHGYSVFSDERYQERSLTPEDLLKHAAPDSTLTKDVQDNVRALLSIAVSDTHSALKSATDSIAAMRKSEATSLPVQILCQIRYAQVKLWKKRHPNLLNESVTLTPLRKFFIAYRAKRRFEPS